jgi:hypothetical protein
MDSLIPEEYYDLDTHALLLTTLTEEDKEHIKITNANIIHFMYTRWRMIVNSFPGNYHNQYLSLTTPESRKMFFTRYLNLKSHDRALMPSFL